MPTNTDKLTAIRIKQQNGQYGPQIPVGAKAENVKYDNQYSVKEVLGNVRTNVAPLQEQIDNIQTETIADTVEAWMDEHADPGTVVVLDDTLTESTMAANAAAAGKLIAINNQTSGNSTKVKFNTTNQIVQVLTTDDIDDTLSISGAVADAKTTGDKLSDLKIQLKYIGLNLCGMDTTKYYPVYIPAGSSVTISTADGQPSEVAVPLYFYNANKEYVTWWPLPINRSQRTISVESDVYFLKFYSVGAKNLMVSFGETAFPYTPYENGYPALKAIVSEHSKDISTLKVLTEKIPGRRISGWGDLNNIGTGYIKTNGGIQASDYRVLSDYIAVLSGNTIVYNNLNCNIGGTSIMAIACYDDSKNFISNAGVQANNIVSGEYTFPSGVAYIRISDSSTKRGTFYFNEAMDQKDAIVDIYADVTQTNLTGLKIALIGDSTYAITGGGSASNERINNYLEKLSGAFVSNFAIGGTLMASIRTVDTWKYYDFVNLMTAKINGDMSEQLSPTNLSGKPGYIATVVNDLNNADLSEYDVLIINYGTNDFTNYVPLTDANDPTSVATFIGAMRTMIDRILTAYPNLHIVFNTPFWRCWNSPSDYVDDAFTRVNNAGLKLDDYIDAITETASGEYGLPVMYNLHENGWNKYNMNTYFESNDGAHFNIAGAKSVARKTFEFLNQQGFALGELS